VEREKARPAATVSKAEEAAPPALRNGQHVRVPKYGRGAVESTAGESVTVRFANGERREFLRAYVRPAERGASAPRP
jgi:hypothetical protein